MPKILIISSQIHEELSSKQLQSCLDLVKKSNYDYEVQVLNAGTYEIPFVINSYAKKKPFDAYIALGLVLKTNADHHDYIMSHIKHSFTHFALNDIIVGNGIISAPTINELAVKIASPDPCLSAYFSAYNAVDALLKIKAAL